MADGMAVGQAAGIVDPDTSSDRPIDAPMGHDENGSPPLQRGIDAPQGARQELADSFATGRRFGPGEPAAMPRPDRPALADAEPAFLQIVDGHDRRADSFRDDLRGLVGAGEGACADRPDFDPSQSVTRATRLF